MEGVPVWDGKQQTPQSGQTAVQWLQQGPERQQTGSWPGRRGGLLYWPLSPWLQITHTGDSWQRNSIYRVSI